jgi:opacity protein-like surface antigen
MMSIGHRILVAVMVAGMVGHAWRAHAANPLRVWQPPETVDASDADDASEADERTPYVAGIVGASFDASTSIGNGSLPMGDAAIGVSIPRPAGAVRLELEGRQRNSLSGQQVLRTADHEAVPTTIDGEWTTMANVWRDVSLGEHATVYAGGGAGVGGYRETARADKDAAGARVTDVAWQVGGGATYAVTERVTLDAGYRYYGVGTDRQVEPSGEVVFAVRIMDPFRGWIR